MLKPAMNKHFFAILLLLLCLLFSGPAEARLTLGIVSGTQDSSGEVSLGQANELAELLTENLQEEVVVKELADSATLINWIDRFAMLDLALLSSKDVEANPGRFLSVGKMHPESDLLLVSRQGIDGEWLQRVAEVLRESGVTKPPIPELDEVISTQVTEEPGLAALPQAEIVLEPVELTEPSTTPASLVGKTVDEPVVPVISEPSEAKTPYVETVVLEPEPLPFTSVAPIMIAEQEQDIVEETGRTKDFSPAGDLTEADSVLDDEVEKPLLDTEILAFLGEDTVASMIAQPDIPQALRPPGIPAVRPSRASTLTETTDELIVATIPKPLRRTLPATPPQLLPDLVPEPGVIYVIPFSAVMVPNDFNARVFDQFVDLLNQGGEDIGLQFVILKEDLQGVDPAWLAVRQYVTGEIYGYVEDSGCCSTDLRTKVRLIYRRPKQELPTFIYEYPVRTFFEHDRSSIAVERVRVADDIATTLSSELLTVLRN